MLAASDHVVAISEDFLPILDSWGVDRGAVTVIENWAPLDELRPVDRRNAWAGRTASRTRRCCSTPARSG